MSYNAAFRCIAGCPGEYPLERAIYRCPSCGDLLEVAHDIEALRDRGPAAWMRLFDERYKRWLLEDIQKHHYIEIKL